MGRINRSLGKGIAALLALLLFFAPALTASAAESGERKVLRVAFPQAEGYTMTAADGKRYGLVVDFLNEIAKYTGWKYEYVDVDNDLIIDRFLAGDYDLMGGTYYAEGYENYFAYPKYSCGYSQLVLLTRKEDSSIKSYDLNTFNGKTIGVFDRADENIRRLKEYLAINALDCTIQYYTYEQLQEQGSLTYFLERGEVDMLLGNSLDAGEGFTVSASFDSQAHYLVTTLENTEVLEELNWALGQIYSADPNFAKKLYDKNFPVIIGGRAELTEKEKAYAAGRGTVTVAVPIDWHPLFCLDNKDGHVGFVPDVLEEVSAFSGLEFSYVTCGSYAESLDKVQQGEADLLGFFVGTEEDAADRDMALTASYVSMDSILVRNKKSTYPAGGLTGAVLEGRELPESIAAEKVVYYSDTAQALADVNRGKVDFYYGSSAHLEYIIQQENFNNVVQVNLVNDNMDICFAMEMPVEPELLTILNKALNELTDGQREAINSRNMVSIGETHMSMMGIVYANPTVAISVVTAFLLLVLAAVILVARLRLRAAAMRGELQKAEAVSRAKSDFLSRMSHEIRTPMNAIVGLADLTGMIEELPDKAKGNLSKIKSSSQYLLGLINDILDMSRIEEGKMEIAREPFSLQVLLKEIKSMLTAEAENRELVFRLEQQIQDDILVGDAIRLRQVLLNLLSNAFKFTPAGGQVAVSVREESSSEKEASFLFRVTDTGVGIAPEDQERIFRSFEQVGPNIAKSQGTGLGLSISGTIVRLMGGELKLQSQPGKGSEFYFSVILPKGELPEEPGAEDGRRERKLLEGITVLLAEDNDLNAEIAVELLELQGAVAHRAVNGKVALEMFQKSDPGGYQVILMDLLMPEMNGLEAARAIRKLERPDAAEVPILAMTANTFREDVEAAADAGMTGFIPKPVDVEYLYRELESVLKKTDHN